jgi:hypothetical protein
LQEGTQIHVLFKGIGEAIEQGIALTAVVGLPFAEQRQPFVLPQLIEPARANMVMEDLHNFSACNYHCLPFLSGRNLYNF